MPRTIGRLGAAVVGAVLAVACTSKPPPHRHLRPAR